jgi:tripeptide aminopeptidase
VRASLDELRDLFVTLAEIPSPSREERLMADAVKRFALDAGLEAVEDDSATVSGCGSGNLVVRVPGRGAKGTAIALCAHLDTVPTLRPPRVIVADGELRSDGGTILGADDKAAVAVLLMVLRDLAHEAPAAGVEVVFTAGEELALLGAKSLDVASLAAHVAFVLDSEGVPGTLITAAPGVKTITASFRGVAAHAGIDPQSGRNAVVAAARAVAAMSLGRLDGETTANVGVVEGGSAVNVVPERCLIRGEARSRNADKLAAQVAAMVQAVTTAAAEVGVDVDIDVTEAYQSYEHAPGSLPLRIAAAAMTEAGLEPRPIGGGGGSDSNVFNVRGLPALTLGVGFEHVHSPQECIRVERLAELYDLAGALVHAAGGIAS